MKMHVNMERIINYAKENIPYYKEWFNKNNILNASIEDIYRNMNFIAKKNMKNSPEFINMKLFESGIPLVSEVTSGTTGEPWVITKTIVENYSYYHMLWRCRRQYGITPKDYYYQFGGYGEVNGVSEAKQIIIRDTDMEFSMYYLNDAVLDSYIDCIQEGKGTWFFANPSALYLLAVRMKHRGIKGIGRVKYVELTGERVYEYQEELIQEVFDCPVSIMYGSREFTYISHRCKYGHNHINPNLYIESINEQGETIDIGSNESGELIITSYIDKLMPLIKYRTGDYGTLARVEACKCGMSGLILNAIEGRTAEYVEVNGVKIHLEIAYYLMDKFNEIYNSRIIQFEVVFKKPNKFVFRFVVESDDIKKIVTNFYISEMNKIIPDVTVETEFVEHIERKQRKLNPYIIE